MRYVPPRCPARRHCHARLYLEATAQALPHPGCRQAERRSGTALAPITWSVVTFARRARPESYRAGRPGSTCNTRAGAAAREHEHNGTTWWRVALDALALGGSDGQAPERLALEVERAVTNGDESERVGGT